MQLNIAEISTLDREQMFRDWGIDAVLHEVMEVFDPGTGERAESLTHQPCRAIPGPQAQAPSTLTAGPVHSQLSSVLIRDEELPAHLDWRRIRISLRGNTYQIHEIHNSSFANVKQLSLSRWHERQFLDTY